MGNHATSIHVCNGRCFPDGCASESEQLLVDDEVRGVLQWPEAAVGARVMLDCPCSPASAVIQASRVCGGDFTSGGRWVVEPACQLDALAWDLCSAQVGMS